MFVDASALAAILLTEPDARDIARRLDTAPTRLISPLAVWETAVAVARELRMEIRPATEQVEEFLERFDIELVAVPPEAAAIALGAFDRYGKGRHPAKLNFGDCFAYACAKVLKQPLLFKGDDFTQTDIEAA